MAKRAANGYILNVRPERRAILLQARRYGDWVAEPVDDFTVSKSHPLISFVSFEDGVITHVAQGRTGYGAGNKLRVLHLEHLTKLSQPVSYDAVLERIPNKFRKHVGKRFASGGLLPPASFSVFVDIVRELLPESNALLDRFS